MTNPYKLLEQAIEERQLTAQQLAELTGRNYGTVWRWLHGRTIPDHASQLILEAKLGIPAASWCVRPQDRVALERAGLLPTGQ